MNQLAERMKNYESDIRIGKDEWILLRIDGRTFSTLLRSHERFDTNIRAAMVDSLRVLMKDIGLSATIGFTNSDEASILLCADVGRMTEHWFGGRVQKIATVAASSFTSTFNYWTDYRAMFDARITIIPPHDVPNYFVWRMRDCRRNALNIVSHEKYGTEAIDYELKRELEATVPAAFLNGTVLTRNGSEHIFSNPTYADFAKFISEQRNGVE